MKFNRSLQMQRLAVRERTIRIAKAWDFSNPIYLDTETTGLDENAEICDIALIRWDGQVIMDTFVRPSIPIPLDATRIHGIKDDDVKDAPTFDEIVPDLRDILQGRVVLIYNAPYDTRMLVQSAKARHISGAWTNGIYAPVFRCVMELYAHYRGEWIAQKNCWRWWKLSDAIRQCGIRPEGSGFHRALFDAQATRHLLHYIRDKGLPDRMESP